MTNLIIAGYDHNGVPDLDPPVDADTSSQSIVNLAVRAFRDHNIDLALEYPDRPCKGLLRGYRMVDKAMYQTMPHPYQCDRDERTHGRVPRLHLIRAGALPAKAMLGSSQTRRPDTD